MHTFGNRIKTLREKNNLTQKQISEIFNITIRSYQRYEANESTPTYRLLLQIADYFKVSIDYLTGRTDNPKINK